MDPHVDLLLTMRSLIEHWIRHPQASDTTEGIHRWWLVPGVDATGADVSAALDWLEHHGAVEAASAADGRVRYRRSAGFDKTRIEAEADALWRTAQPGIEPPAWNH